MRALLMFGVVLVVGCGGPSVDDAGTSGGGAGGGLGGGADGGGTGGGGGSTNGDAGALSPPDAGAPSGSDAGGIASGDAGAPGPLGASCQAGLGCASGFCVDGVCCDSACTDQCSACSAVRTGGANGTCAPLPNGGVCRPSVGACDVAEICTNGTCAPDLLLTVGTTCRAAAGLCDVAEVCTGTSGECPSDGFMTQGATCRAGSDLCDSPETCSGASGACPADERFDAGHVCRPAQAGCDLAEVCDGIGTQCPADEKKAAGAVCRGDAGVCDLVEFCNGIDATCPTDVFVSNLSLACSPYRCPGNGPSCTSSCASTDNECATDARSVCIDNQCQRGRFVFVSSLVFNPNFAAGIIDGGTARADSLCQAMAVDGGLGGTYKAWLSDTTSSPSSRFVRDGGAYIRATDKARIATSWANLTDGTISSVINVTEKGQTASFGTYQVITGTTTNGTSATFSGGQTNTHCAGWTNSSNSFNGTYGSGGSFTNSVWTNAGNALCSSMTGTRVFCFEQ